MLDILSDMRHCEVKQNLAVWSQGAWQYFNVDYIESLPVGSPSVQNFGAAAANATIAQAEATVLGIDDNQLLQVRAFPIDDVEVVVWLTSGQQKFNTRGMHARISKMTRAIDPYLRTTEFNCLGRDRNAFVEIRNLGDYAIAQSRVCFYAQKYILKPLINIVEREDATGIVRPYVQQSTPAGAGRPAGATLTLVPMKYIDAEARMS